MAPTRKIHSRLRHPVYKRLSNLRAGAPYRPSGGRSLNAKYDQKRISLPIEYTKIQSCGITSYERSNDLVHRLDEQDADPEDDGVATDEVHMSTISRARKRGLQRLDDLLSGRIRPRRAAANPRRPGPPPPLRSFTEREQAPELIEIFAEPHHHFGVHQRYANLARGPAAPLRDSDVDIQFQPDMTSTPTSQIPPYTPSPPVIPDISDPTSRDTVTVDHRSQDCSQKPPARRGILKNCHIEPFYPSFRRPVSPIAGPSSSSVRFRSTPDQHFISRSWSSDSDPVTTSRLAHAQPSGHMRFHDRFVMRPGGFPLDNMYGASYQMEAPTVTNTQSRVPSPLVRAHRDLLQDSPIVSTNTFHGPSSTPTRTWPTIQAPKHAVHVNPGPHAHEDADVPVLRRLELSIDSMSFIDDGDDEDGTTAVGTDELNLRSIDDDQLDYRHHANYPQHVKSEPTGQQHDPIEDHPVAYSSRPLTLTEKVWTFDVPREVDLKTRREFKHAKVKGQVKGKSNSKRSSSNSRNKSLKNPVPLIQEHLQESEVNSAASIRSATVRPPKRIDDTLETISVFSDEGSRGTENLAGDVAGEVITMPSPDAETEEDRGESSALSASQIRRKEMEGFFAPGTNDIGFRIWRDGY